MKFVTQDYYQILNVSPEANGEEVKRAYRTVRQSFRPDSMAVHSLYSPEETETISAKIDEAFQILSQPELAGNYRRYHRHGRADMTIPRSPEVFFDEVHELDARSPIEALAMAVSSRKESSSDFDEDFPEPAGADNEDYSQPANDNSAQRVEPALPQAELFLNTLEEVEEISATSRAGSSRRSPSWTPTPLSLRSSQPGLGAVSVPGGTEAMSSPVTRSPATGPALTSPSLRTLLPDPVVAASQQHSAARNLSPSSRVASREFHALPDEELEAIEVDCQGINGAYLRTVRETLDLDLFYIAAQTKIGRAMLSYIEDDRTEDLPARVYLKGYLCHIARLLKLPEARTAERYLANLEAR